MQKKKLSMQKRVGLTLMLSGMFILSYGQQDSLSKKENPFHFEVAYVGDMYGNAVGGLKRGGSYMGMGNLMMGFSTEKAHWWNGGSFFINGATIHGKSLSENYLGDIQVASNIDAGTHIYLHELWFKQEFAKFSFTVGLQDMNVDFMASENGGEFINSSFGVPPVISGNIPVPIFPLTGLGLSTRWDINDRFAWQVAVFDGCQKPFDLNRHNLHWGLGKDDGVFAITEFHSKFNIKEKEGIYKLGGYYHSGLNEFDEDTQTVNPVFKNNYGLYILADQTVFERGNRKIGLFAQFDIAPKKGNEHNYYVGLGANYYGLVSKKGKDILGLAVAHLGLHKTDHKHETALELYYKWQFNEHFAIQPDIQYVINPSGTDVKLSNALMGLLRLHINF